MVKSDLMQRVRNTATTSFTREIRDEIARALKEFLLDRNFNGVGALKDSVAYAVMGHNPDYDRSRADQRADNLLYSDATIGGVTALYCTSGYHRKNSNKKSA